MELNKANLLKEYNVFEKLKLCVVESLAEEKYYSNDSLSLDSSNIDELLFSKIFSHPDFLSVKVSHSTNFSDWCSELNNFNSFIIINKDFEIENLIFKFNDFYDDLTNYEEYSSSYDYDYEDDSSY